MRKVFVEAKVKFVLEMEEGIEVTEVLAGMDCLSTTEGADITDVEVLRVEVTDSK